MKRVFAVWLLIVLLLTSCGGEPPAPELPEEPEELTLPVLSLEFSAPARGGGDFPAAARAFAEEWKTALAAEGICAERVELSFSRADAATAQALREGGVSLGILSPLAALREDGIEPIAFMSRTAEGSSRGVIAASDSSYGRQLASRAAGESAVSFAEWNRAVIGAVESDALLYAAADYAFTELTAYGLAQLGSFRSFETEEELLAAMEAGEVDAALLRKERSGSYAVLLETDALYEAVLAVSTAAEELTGEWVSAALTRALTAAAETDAGRGLLEQYGCAAWTQAEKEETEALARLAKWEDIQ